MYQVQMYEGHDILQSRCKKFALQYIMMHWREFRIQKLQCIL